MNVKKINTQIELDEIGLDFIGKIEIYGKNIILKKKYPNSSVVARENSSVEAWENSSVVAWENSSVVARENSSVVARGFSQVCIFSNLVKITTFEMGRYIKPNENINNFAIYHSLEIKDNHIIMYKSVNTDLASFYDSNFKYEVGKIFVHECDTSVEKNCSFGLHVSSIDFANNFALEKVGKNNFKILECFVPLDKIVLPINSNGKIRTSELYVNRIVE